MFTSFAFPRVFPMGGSLSGDPAGVGLDAFASLYERHESDVTRLCTRLLGAGPDVEDARSEAFLRARQAFAQYDPSRPFRRWVLGVAANHCIDRLRRRRVEGRIFEAAEVEEGALPGPGPSPLGAALQAEERRRLLEAMDELDDRHRVPLVLRYFAELSYEEIAEATGISSSAIGPLLYRARVKLRAALRAEP